MTDVESPPPPTAERAVVSSCPNCGTAAPGNFCPECGQEQISVRLGLRDLAREFLDDHVGWSTKVPRTVGRLLIAPGALTLDFIEGRRARYLSPLRLYLLLSVIFFLVAAAAPRWAAERGTVVRFSMEADSAAVLGADSGETAAAGAAGARADSIDARIATNRLDTTTFEGRLKLRLLRRNSDFQRMDESARREALIGGLVRRMPNVMFVLLPLFALLVQAVTWRRRRFYAEHFVFALHIHAFAFAAFLLMALSPWDGAAALLLVASVAYLVAALRRVYGGSVLRNALQAVLLAVSYNVVVATAALAVGVFVFLYG